MDEIATPNYTEVPEAAPVFIARKQSSTNNADRRDNHRPDTHTDAVSRRMLPQPRLDHMDTVLAMEGHALAEGQLLGAYQRRRESTARDESAKETTRRMRIKMARYYDVDYEPGTQRSRYEGARGFFQRAGDEMRSWFGDERAERRRGRDDYEYERHGRQGEYSRPGYAIDDLRAGDLMSRNVLTVYPDDRVGYAARQMRDWDCGALPVVDREGRWEG